MKHAIPGCDGFEASTDGQIYKAGSNTPKKQRPAGNGALQVDIAGVTRMVHDLVARAVHGVPPPGYRAKHRNGDLSDNRASNLAWSGSAIAVTQSPTTPLEIEREYQRIENERLALIELMQA